MFLKNYDQFQPPSGPLFIAESLVNAFTLDVPVSDLGLMGLVDEPHLKSKSSTGDPPLGMVNRKRYIDISMN